MKLFALCFLCALSFTSCAFFSGISQSNDGTTSFPPALQTMKTLLATLLAIALTGCSTQSVVSNQIAHSAVTAVAKHYGGAKAGELASAGLYAAADVMQGYVAKTPPLEVAANSPGVQGVGQVVVDMLKTKGWITQKTVNNLHLAAQIAANITTSTVNEGP